MEDCIDSRHKTPEARLVGLTEAARRLGVTPRSVQNLVMRGVILPVRLPGLRRTLLDLRDIEQLVETGKSRTPSTHKISPS